MKICTRSRYKKRPDHGLIRVTRFIGKRPVEFSLQLYNEKKGFLTLNKSRFPTVEAAQAYASIYGFSLGCWLPEEKEF